MILEITQDPPTKQTLAALICILATALIAIILWGKAALLNKDGNKVNKPTIDPYDDLEDKL